MGFVALNTRATKDLRRKLRDFSLTVVPSRLSQRGAPAWRRVITACKRLPTGDALHIDPVQEHTQQVNIPSNFLLSCPYCKRPSVVARRTLYARGIFAQLTCAACFICATARKWLCDCGHPWVGCPVHAQVGFACHKVSFSRSSKIPQGETEKMHPDSIRKRVCTNDVPPPLAHQVGQVKRTRYVVSGSRGSASASSHAGTQSRPATLAQSQRGKTRKRPASVQASGHSKRNTPHPSASAVAAIDRLRVAREHPF